MKIKNWDWDNSKRLYVRRGFTDDVESKIGKHGDVVQKEMYNPRKVRWYNSFEMAQQIRFMICLEWIRQHFQDLARKEKKKRLIIDLGCSRSFVYQFWRHNCNYFGWPQIHYWGVDANYKRIEEGRNMFVKKKNDRVVYFLADLACPLRFPAKADVVVCMEVIEHLPPRKVLYLLNNVKNALNSTGIAIISSPNPESKGEWVWENSEESHHYEYTWKEARKIFENNGLVILDRTGVLPYRNYRSTTTNPYRNQIANYLPAPLVNNVLLTGEVNMYKKKMWICKVKKS